MTKSFSNIRKTSFEDGTRVIPQIDRFLSKSNITKTRSSPAIMIPVPFLQLALFTQPKFTSITSKEVVKTTLDPKKNTPFEKLKKKVMSIYFNLKIENFYPNPCIHRIENRKSWENLEENVFPYLSEKNKCDVIYGKLSQELKFLLSTLKDKLNHKNLIEKKLKKILKKIEEFNKSDNATLKMTEKATISNKSQENLEKISEKATQLTNELNELEKDLEEIIQRANALPKNYTKKNQLLSKISTVYDILGDPEEASKIINLMNPKQKGCSPSKVKRHLNHVE